MIIKSTIRAAKVNPTSAPKLKEFISERHDIAWSNDLNNTATPASSNNENICSRELDMTGGTLENLAKDEKSKRASDLRMAYLNLGMNATSLAGHYFPEVLKQPIEGMEFVVASANAFEAWSDPTSTSNVKATMATGKVLLEAIDVLAPYVPGLENVKPYSKVAGIILKTAESAYIVYTATNKHD